MQQYPCRGLSSDQIGRRSFLHTTVTAGTAGVSLPTILASRAAAKDRGEAVKDTAVIQVWLGGGPTHFETYDPKPEAPAEYRGSFNPIDTNLSGVRICETLPQHAKMMDKIALIRSVDALSGSHDVGMYICTTGKPDKYQPSTGSYISKIRGANATGVPPYVHLGFKQTANLVFADNFKASYLGTSHDPFYLHDDPSSDQFKVPNLTLVDGVGLDRLSERKGLLRGFDRLRHKADASGMMDAVDQFNLAAFEMITGPRARAAFDLSREDRVVRERYGMHRWGQSCLLARRLVEAGVTFVTVNFDPHSYSFDMHGNVESGMKSAGPRMDTAIPSLVNDLYDRGLDKNVLLVVWGEFGRTPRINANGGRDHWGPVMSMFLSGGGLRVGQVIGSSSPKGEVPRDRPMKPYDVLATMYRHLGIDPKQSFLDHTGRPRYILDEGEVIPEFI